MPTGWEAAGLVRKEGDKAMEHRYRSDARGGRAPVGSASDMRASDAAVTTVLNRDDLVAAGDETVATPRRGSRPGAHFSAVPSAPDPAAVPAPEDDGDLFADAPAQDAAADEAAWPWDDAPAAEAAYADDAYGDADAEAAPAGAAPYDEAPDAARDRAAARRRPRTAAAPNQLVTWGLEHQGAAFALGAVAVVCVAALGFFLAFGAITAGADARAREAGAADDAPTETVDTSLPAVNVRFSSLSADAFPTVTVDLVLSRDDGQPMDPLTSSDFVLTEHDDDDNEADASITAFSFDTATGAGSLTYTANEDDLDLERTLDVSFNADAGIRGGGSLTYRAPDKDERVSAEDAEWILPDSDTHRYTAAELADYSDDDLFVARNEIFARHGRMFGDSYLQRYFESTSWYKPRYTAEQFDAMPTPLNAIEIANVNTIRSVEQSR